MAPLTTKSNSPWIQRESSWFFALGLLTGLAMSAAFALGVWIASRGESQRVAQTAPAAGRDVESVKVVTTAPPKAPEPAPSVSPEPRPKRKLLIGADRLPEADIPASVPVLMAAAGSAPGMMPERFALRDPPAQQVPSFVLPKDTWFALGKVTAEEPEAAEPMVCRADRSLGTALTWAKSPAEASERAAREGKLVFLIHVSGNFEDPGFT